MHPIVFIAMLASISLLSSPSFAEPRRYAEPNEGIWLNQEVIPLQNGLQVYLPAQDKVVPAERVFPEKDAAQLRQSAINSLNHRRYWASGSPPEESMVSRMRHFVKGAKAKRRATKGFLREFQDESWFKGRARFEGEADVSAQEPDREPPDQGG